ncbi:hypothetical protein BaRGS_00031822 [Batillaria attramentaria]|uniref:AIG1-type G domain-containing protein n=1 Tax=Batillaria attramentaria TaxID=370345 RepID=A0ABD0JPG9_9CAEN
MDCPGLYDTSKTLREACSDIVQAITRMHPGPHAFLYVIRLGRYTEEEYRTYNRLKTLLGQNVVNYMVVVFTGGDMLEGGDNTLEELLHSTAPARLAKVLSECSQRYVVFNNLARDKRSQVDQLLAEVDQIMKRNDDEPFTCDPHIQREVQKELELSASFSDRGADTESEDEVSEGASRGSLSRFRDVVASDSGVITKLAGMLHRRLTTFFSSTTEEKLTLISRLCCHCKRTENSCLYVFAMLFRFHTESLSNKDRSRKRLYHARILHVLSVFQT